MECTGYNGKIVVEGDQLILTHTGRVAKISGLVTDQPRRIPLRAVSGVSLKSASRLTNGWLTLGVGGGDATQVGGGSAGSNPNTVMFRHKDREQFQALYEKLLAVVENNRAQGIDPSTVEFEAAQPTRLERLESKQEALSAHAAAGRNELEANRAAHKYDAKYEGVIISGSELKIKGKGAWNVGDCAASVDQGANLQPRLTATRVALIGPLALLLKKGRNKVFLMVETPDETHLVELNAKEEGDARRFAVNANNAAKYFSK